MMKKKTTTATRITCSLLVVLILATAFAVTPAAAVESQCLVGWGTTPVMSNLNNGRFPECPSGVYVGQTLYMNQSATTDWTLDWSQFYVKGPNDSGFRLISTYNPSGYFRYSNASYTPSVPGTYTMRVVIRTTSGWSGSAEHSVNVISRPSSSASAAPAASSNTPAKWSDPRVRFDWVANTTCSTRDPLFSFSINGTRIVPGTIHPTYYRNGVQSTAGNAYYCKVGNSLVYVGGAQCLNYAYYLQLLLYGSCSQKTTLYDKETDDGITDFYGVRYYKELSAAEYKNLLQKTGAGTHLRCFFKDTIEEHSIFVLRVDENGFYYTDANTSTSEYGRNNIKVGYTTYSSFANGDYKKLKYLEYFHG